LSRLEEGKESIPGVRDIGDSEARLLDQRIPDMERPARDLHGHHCIAALIRHAVIEEAGIDRELEKVLFLRLDDVADIDELIVPGLQWGKLKGRQLPSHPGPRRW